MLPEFPKLQVDLAEWMRRFVVSRIRFHLGGLAEIPWTTIFEGHGNTITRADGTREDTDMILGSTEMAIPLDELAKLSLDDLAIKYDAVAKNLAQQQAEAMYASIAKGVAAVGNTVDAGGKPLSPELFLEAIEKIHMDFDSTGKAKFPGLHVSPDMHEKAKAVIEEVLTNLDLNRRFEVIMARKLEDWRAREARRELAG
jgi:hypothetical protein